MKKNVFVLLMLVTSIMSFGQDRLRDLATDAELEWNDDTRDKAYLAPNSQFTGKKWHTRKSSYFIFNANGTWKSVGHYEDDTSYDQPVKYVETHFGVWKRNKSYITMQQKPEQTTVVVDMSSISNLSARKKDMIVTDFKNEQAYQRKEKYGIDNFEILKLEKDLFFLAGNAYLYFFSENKVKELLGRKN